MSVRRAGAAGGVAAAPPPVAMRCWGLAQPTRKQTTAARAGVDVGTILATVDWDITLALAAERSAFAACAITAQLAGLLLVEASRDFEQPGRGREPHAWQRGCSTHSG